MWYPGHNFAREEDHRTHIPQSRVSIQPRTMKRRLSCTFCYPQPYSAYIRLAPCTERSPQRVNTSAISKSNRSLSGVAPANMTSLFPSLAFWTVDFPYLGYHLDTTTAHGKTAKTMPRPSERVFRGAGLYHYLQNSRDLFVMLEYQISPPPHDIDPDWFYIPLLYIRQEKDRRRSTQCSKLRNLPIYRWHTFLPAAECP